MSKKDFRQRVLEQQIFDELKDTSIRSSKHFKTKYQGADIDFTRLYTKIVNYKIKEYGQPLSTDLVPKKTYEDCLREGRNKRQRIYKRKNYERKN